MGGGTKTRRPIALRMQYNPDCDQPRCYLSLEDGKEEPRSLEEIQVVYRCLFFLVLSVLVLVLVACTGWIILMSTTMRAHTRSTGCFFLFFMPSFTPVHHVPKVTYIAHPTQCVSYFSK